MTPLRVIDNPNPKEHPHRYFVPDGVEPGDCWRVPQADLPDRESWAIVLPNGAGIWLTTDTAGGTGNLWWTVTGTPPDLTVTPSINAEPEWHGFITNGEMA